MEPDVLLLEEQDAKESDDATKVYTENVGSDEIGRYLRFIGRYPLLSAEEDLRLGREIAAAARERKKTSERQRAEVLQRGQDAVRKLTNANLRLVVSMAKRYSTRSKSLFECIQEGNVGLLLAAHKYDYTKRLRFSTYATWWIRQALNRGVSENRIIGIPAHLGDDLYQLSCASQYLGQELGHEPSVEELAKETGLQVAKVRKLLSLAYPLSLNKPIEQPEGDTVDLEASLPDQGPGPEEDVTRRMLSQHLRQVVGTLPERWQVVLRLRYGLDDGISRTFAEVGVLLQISASRAQQIERSALAMLREPQRLRLLEHALDT